MIDRPPETPLHIYDPLLQDLVPDGLEKFDPHKPDRLHRDRLKVLLFCVGIVALLSKWLGYW